jgi:transcriptional regulator with XRE-family HTH domain
MSTNLDESVRAGLVSRRGDWQAIAAEAKVSHSWISKFVNGHIPNPSYSRLLRLQQYLSTAKTA